MREGQYKGRAGWRPYVWAGIAMVLLAPLLAMQFTDQVRWTGFDFAVAATLLVGTLAIYELASRFVSSRRSRALVGSGLALLVLLIWAEGAVGII